MGRKKVQLRRIEDKSSRLVTFSKRRNGLMKKARELSVLCDVDVALVIFSSRGKHYQFSNGNSMANILGHYKSLFEEEGKASKGAHEAENYHSEYANLRTSAELLQIVQRDLDGPHVEQLTLTDFMQLEKQLDAALAHIRTRQTQMTVESLTTLCEKERMLREENKRLEEEIAAMEKNGLEQSKEVDMGGCGTLGLLR